jgi:hypothetical protein
MNKIGKGKNKGFFNSKSSDYNINICLDESKEEISKDQITKDEIVFKALTFQKEVIKENETEEQTKIRRFKDMCHSLNINIPQEGEITSQRLSSIVMYGIDPYFECKSTKKEEVSFLDMLKNN